MEASPYQADGILAKELEDELMKYTKKYDYKAGTNFVENSKTLDTNLVAKTGKAQAVDANLVEKTDEIQMTGDVEVNITECTRSLGNQLVATEYQDATESSSSFDDSNCGAENVDTVGDSEASSEFRGDTASALDFDGFGERFRMRKKKLTTHWRSFIQPLMWRCKWVEMQIKKLEAQSQQYDRELEAYEKLKQTQLDDSTMIDGVKSLPFSWKNAKNDVFKRKKRRRAEATMDVAAYMSDHNLFSCYENRKCLTEGAFMNNDSKNPATQKIKIEDDNWGNDELLAFEPGDGDNSLGSILRKIDFLQSHVGMLKSKLDGIMRVNAERLSLADELNLSPPSNENRTEGTYIASQSTSVLVPQTAVTSHGDFPFTNGSIGRASYASIGAHECVGDGVLIDHLMVKEETNSFEEVKIHQIQRPLVLNDGSGNTTTPILAETPLELRDGLSNTTAPVLAEPDLLADDRPPQKIRSIAKLTAPRTKRKRGRKRSSAGRRGRRSSG